MTSLRSGVKMGLMKKLFLYIFTFLMVCSNSFAIVKKYSGEGELFLNEKIIEEYLNYLNTKTQDHPLNFFISEDKKHVFVVILKDTNYKRYSGSGPISRNKKKCERKLKQKCYLFSNTRFIVWNNGINPIIKEESFIKGKITRENLISKLEKLGFIGESKNETKKIVSQKKSNEEKKNDQKEDEIKELENELAQALTEIGKLKKNLEKLENKETKKEEKTKEEKKQAELKAEEEKKEKDQASNLDSIPECKGTNPNNWTNCKGTFTWTSGEFAGDKYIGEWKDGKYHGQGTLMTLGGDKYIGEWKDDKRHGQGTLINADSDARGALDKYVGEWKDDKWHGQGTLTWANANEYVGEFRNGKQHGQGTLTRGDYIYAGGWKDGKWHGQGTFTDLTTNKTDSGIFRNDGYLGQCIEGNCINGQGTFIYAYHKGKYIGEFKEILRHGQGTYLQSNGIKYFGEWKDDELIYGTNITTKMGKYVGEWEDFYRHGQGTNTYPDGTIYVGGWKDGFPHGKGTATFPDGRVEKGIWQKGKLYE